MYMSESVWEKDLNWKAHEESAKIIPNWKTTNKNDLIRQCVEYDRQGEFCLRDGVFSAIILKYWHKILSTCFKSKMNRFNMEDYYGWLVDSVWYAIKKTPWENPNSHIYKDPLGPDKVVSQVFKTLKNRAKQTSDYDKHILNYISESLDVLNEIGFDFATDTETSRNESATQVYTIIKNYFVSHKDIEALVIYALCNEDVYVGTRASYSKIAEVIANINYSSISTTYDIEPSRVEKISHLNKNYLKQVVKKTMTKLKSDTKLKECLSC